jgi:hypothetical protein
VARRAARWCHPVTAWCRLRADQRRPKASRAGVKEPSAQLTAWTVTKQADGTISVTVRELSDAAGLQHSLRADGVPATVTFESQQNPACPALHAFPSPSQR